MKLTNLILPVAALLLLNSCNKGVEPQEVNYHNKILFSSSRSGKEQLFMMNPDGTDIRQITNGPYSHGGGKWSPDVTQIVCNTEEYSTTAGIEMVAMNVDGTNRRYLGYGALMSWSPDGKKIAFSHPPRAELGDRREYIYLINPDGTGRLELPNDGGIQETWPSWSPDGKTIAFTSDRDYLVGPLRNEIYLMNPDGSNQRRLTFTDSVINGAPSWSPDGSMFAFHSNGEIALINKDGSGFRLITSQSVAKGYVLLQPRWSVNGSQLILLGHVIDGTARSYLYMVNRDGSNLHRILDDATVFSADWSW